MIDYRRFTDSRELRKALRTLKFYFKNTGKLLHTVKIQEYAMRESPISLSDAQAGIALIVFSIEVAIQRLLEILASNHVPTIEEFLSTLPITEGGISCCGWQSKELVSIAFEQTYEFICTNDHIKEPERERVINTLSDPKELKEVALALLLGILYYDQRINTLCLKLEEQHHIAGKIRKFERPQPEYDNLAAGHILDD